LLLRDQNAVASLGGPTPPEGPVPPNRTRNNDSTARRERARQGPSTSSRGGTKCVSPRCKRKCNLRGKRSDPSSGANGRPKAGAVPAAQGADVTEILQAHQHLVWRAVSGRERPNRAQRPHSRNPGRQRPGRSRHETETSACRGEWRRGAHGPRKRERLTCANGGARGARLDALAFAGGALPDATLRGMRMSRSHGGTVLAVAGRDLSSEASAPGSGAPCRERRAGRGADTPATVVSSRVGTLTTGTAPACGRSLAPRYGSDLLPLRLRSRWQ
jgi:hypothetical protein